jgi:hypothetical protein
MTSIFKAVFCTSLACAPAFASLTFVTTPGGLGSNDSTSWAQLGGDTTALGPNFTATSGLGVGVTGNFGATDNKGIVAVVCPSTPSCGWTTSGTGMNAGDTDIWAFDNGAAKGGAGTGPITLAFSTALVGVGAWIEGDTGGTYTGSIQAFNGGTSLGAASTFTSDGTGDPIFLGLVNSPALANITSVVFSLTSCTGCTNLGDFAMDTLLMTDQVIVSSTPEPSSMLLLGGGLAGMAFILRRMNSRKS